MFSDRSLYLGASGITALSGGVMVRYGVPDILTHKGHELTGLQETLGGLGFLAVSVFLAYAALNTKKV